MTSVLRKAAPLLDCEDSGRINDLLLREVGRLARVGFWQYDVATEQTLWSAEMYQLFGCDHASGAVTFKEHARMYAQNEAMFRGLVRRTINSSERTEAVFQQEFPDGRCGWHRLVMHPDRGAQGKVVRVIGIVFDLTAQQRLRAQLRKYRDRLKRGAKESSKRKAKRRQSPAKHRDKELPKELLALTPRELQICLEVHKGLTSKEIAHNLGIALSSVETHRRNLRRKLGINRQNLQVYLQLLFGYYQCPMSGT